jgi:hypothetical protein
MATSWCNKLASTPSVGFRFKASYYSGDAILHSLAPLLNSWAKPMKPGFTIQVHESFRIQLISDDGFLYAFDHDRMSVEFRHRLKIKAQSGGPPTAELISQPRPFTELLPEVANRAIEAIELVYGAKIRTLERIGVVSTTSIAGDEAPPGIKRLLNYFGQPWNNELDYFDINMAGLIEKTEDYTDRCIHSLKRPENKEELMSIKFDWQRTFSAGKNATSDVLKKQASVAQEAALKYLEEIGEGNRLDEYINSNAK